MGAAPEAAPPNVELELLLSGIAEVAGKEGDDATEETAYPSLNETGR